MDGWGGRATIPPPSKLRLERRELLLDRRLPDVPVRPDVEDDDDARLALPGAEGFAEGLAEGLS
jgi:hypothetical protein